MKNYEIRLSTQTSGVTLKNLSGGNVRNKIDALLGTDGLTKITVSWESVEDAPLKSEELVSDLDIIDDVVEEPTPLSEESGSGKLPSRTTEDSIPPFEEMERISKTKLAKYININVFNMGYHDQGDGKIVICYGTTKVYTSWEDMFKLPTFIDNKSIEGLNNLKQVAVRNFRKWMATHPDKNRNTKIQRCEPGPL